MFLTRDIGAVRGPTDDFWYSPIGGSASGARVTSDTAMRLSTVYKCVRVRSETIGMLPLLIYRRLPDGGKDVDTAHPLYGLLHDSPNPWQTSMMWRQMMQAHLDLRGNAYSEIVYDGAGRIDMLVPLDPDRMRVEVLPDRMPRYRYRTGTSERVFVFGEIVHLAGLSADGYTGMNPIEVAREAIGGGLAARDYGARYFGNTARAPAWIKMPGKFANPEDRERWVGSFAQSYGGMNSGRWPVLENGLEVVALPQISNTDAQFLDSRKYSDIDITGLFRTPPHKVGILDRATWNNIEHQQLDFVTDTIMPSCVVWEQALQRDLDFGPDAFPEYKLAGLLRGDTSTRYQAYGKGIQDGWLTRNEARAFENMNPLPGLDEPLEPLNMAPAGSRGADQARGVPPGAQRGDRAVAVMTAAAERVARKELALIKRAHADTGAAGLAEAFAGHARFVAEVMAASTAAAEAHVADTLSRAQAWLAAPGTVGTDVIDTQVAALLRLEN